ncbi:MAG: HAD hydrolase family protein [Pseudomonadota bacterium]
MNESVKVQLAAIELIGFDVDGVFTDGRLYISDDGSETKVFNTQDGFGIRRLLDAGVSVAVISGRHSAGVERRMKELGVQHVHLGCKDKVAVFEKLLHARNLRAEQAAFVGDDVPDLGVLEAAGVAIGVANAHASITEFCDWVTARSGGAGAVREVCDAVLAARAEPAGKD